MKPASWDPGSKKAHVTRRGVLLAGAIALGTAFPDRVQPLQASALSQGQVDFLRDAQAVDQQAGESTVETTEAFGQVSTQQTPPTRSQIVNTFTGRKPIYWGLQPPGALTRLPQGESGMVLTVDFCGGPGGNGHDETLLTVLRDRRVPTILFLNSRWIAANLALAQRLAVEPLFELANHGTSHCPLSTTGKSAYGVPGTQNAGEVYDEVMTNDAALTLLAGKRPRFYRPGTAYLDEVAVQIVGELGLTPVGFSINGDGGATFPAPVVAEEIGKAQAGDIIICHGNHPSSGTAEGMARALDKLAASGVRFVPIP